MSELYQPQRPGWSTRALIADSVAAVVLIAAFVGLAVGVRKSAKPRQVPQLTAADIIAAGRSDMQKAKSYHVVATSKTDRLEISVQDAGTVEIGAHEHGWTANAILYAGRFYQRGDAAFMRMYAPQLVPYAGRWLMYPQGMSVGPIHQLLSVSDAVNCFLGNLGRLERGADATLNGVPAHVVIDRGGVPGSTPAQFYFAAEAPPDLLRIVVTGTTVPGAPAPSCQTKLNATSAAEEYSFNFDNWGGDVRVGAPPEPIALTR